MSASFDAYKVFYYVGKYNNITHAANALFLSQSTVSRSIQSLESDLGCKLFERFQHGVVLTAEGEMLYSHVARACEEIQLGEERLNLLHSDETSLIRLGADNFIFSRFVLPLMKDFSRDFPDARIETGCDMVSSPESCIRSLLRSETDAVFTLGPIPETPGLVTAAMGEYTDVFVAGKGLGEKLGDNPRLYDVSLMNFVSLNRGIGGREYLRAFFSGHGMRMEPTYQVEDIRHLLQLVNMDMGLALIPSPLLEMCRQFENIVPLNVTTALPRRIICMLTAKNTPQNLPRDEFIKRIRKNMYSALV